MAGGTEPRRAHGPGESNQLFDVLIDLVRSFSDAAGAEALVERVLVFDRLLQSFPLEGTVADTDFPTFVRSQYDTYKERFGSAARSAAAFPPDVRERVELGAIERWRAQREKAAWLDRWENFTSRLEPFRPARPETGGDAGVTAATSPPEHHRVDADDLGREELERLLKELEGEGWTGRTVMLAVMPRLFDLLDADELDATAAGLRENGVPEAELAVLMPRAAEAGEIDPYLPFEDVRPIDARRKLDPGSVEFVFGPHSIALSGYSQRSPVPFDPDHHLFQVDQLARGLAELRDGRPDAAQIHFRRAAYLELNTSGADAALLGGLALCAAGRPADAITLMSHHNPTDDIGYWYGLLEDLGDDVSPDLETLRIGVTPGLTVEMPPSAQAIAWALVGAAHATGRWFVAARWLAALVEADFEAGEMALPLLDALPDSPDVLRALVMPLSGLGIQRSTLDEKARGRLAVRPSMSRHRRT